MTISDVPGDLYDNMSTQDQQILTEHQRAYFYARMSGDQPHIDLALKRLNEWIDAYKAATAVKEKPLEVEQDSD